MQTIKLDLQRQSILTPLKAKQNDRYSRFFKVVLLDGSTAFSIPSGAALTVRYIAPSGSGWYDTITEIDNTTKHSAFSISGNEVTVELAEATLTKPGNGMLCLQIYAATGYRIGTWNIPLEIEADPLADSTIAASDYYNVLTGQVAQALAYRDAAAASATSAAASAALAQQISQQSKGWFATDAALKAAFPTGQNGWWAIVGAGDNIWTWDADTNAWVNTHTQTDLSNYYTKAQADAAFLGKTETAEDTKKFGGQLPAYYATAEGLAKFGKLLWSGSFSSGSITVPGISSYNTVCVTLAGDVMCFGTRAWGIGSAGGYGSYTISLFGYRLYNSGETLTIDDSNKGGSDGTQNIAITAIYGLF